MSHIIEKKKPRLWEMENKSFVGDEIENYHMIYQRGGGTERIYESWQEFQEEKPFELNGLYGSPILSWTWVTFKNLIEEDLANCYCDIFTIDESEFKEAEESGEFDKFPNNQILELIYLMNFHDIVKFLIRVDEDDESSVREFLKDNQSYSIWKDL